MYTAFPLDTKVDSQRFDLYYGGAAVEHIPSHMAKFLQEYTCITPKAKIPSKMARTFALSKSVQDRCETLYYYISRDGFWLIDQLEVSC